MKKLRPSNFSKVSGAVAQTKSLALISCSFRSFSDTFKNPRKSRFNQRKWLTAQIKIVRLYVNDFHYQNKALSLFIYFSVLLLIYLTLFQERYYFKMTFSEFLATLSKGEIESLTVFKYFENFEHRETVVSFKTGGSMYRTQIIDYQLFIESLEKAISEFQEMKVESVTRSAIHQILEKTADVTQVLMISAIIFQMVKNMSKGKSNNPMLGTFDKNKSKKFTKEMNLNVKFDDVAGMQQSKLEITEFVDFLKHPQRYLDIGAKLPKGALLSGPPGTGKTMLAKACAGEANVPFFFVSGSEFIELFVGLGASRVRDLFSEAKKNSPCIIFIDEIDAVGKKRSEKLGSNSEADSTLNQILVEMDGFDTNSQVIIFAATNRKELLDSALTRPGRFDRCIDITLPDIDGRREIFMIHLKKITLEEGKIEKHASRLASLTPGFSGAEIANVCNEAAIQAVRGNKKEVGEYEFEIAVERIIGGIEKKRSENLTEIRTVAVHESGHGVVSWFLEGASPLLKLTIIPRSKGALGFAQYLPNEVSLETKEQLMDKIVAVLAGRCAEEEFFGKITSGAYDDLQKAYKIAHAIVVQLAMTEKFANVAHEENDYGMKSYSDSTSDEIDGQIKAILEDCTQRCQRMVKKHRNLIEALSDELVIKETINLREITRILGERPFETNRIFKAYLEHV